MAALRKCTIGPRHKWEWLKDVTNVSMTITERGTCKKLSRRGVFKCQCGATRQGQPRTGL